MEKYKHSCVVDVQGNYIEFVLVMLEPDENGIMREQIQCYIMQPEDRLLEVLPPIGMVKARWTDTEWRETATPEEIVAYKAAQQALFS